MYAPKLYRNNDLPEIERFIRKNSFATLVSQHDNRHWATHIPLELEINEQGQKVLWGHLSKANPQWKSFAEQEVMAIFLGPHTYISPSWYDHANVPTWNYIAVHVYGKAKLVEGDQLREALKRLINKHEAVAQKPVSMDSMPEDFLNKEIKGVAGLEISIERIEGAWKLSQNRDDKNFQNIILELERLQELNAESIAEEMKKLRPEL